MVRIMVAISIGMGLSVIFACGGGTGSTPQNPVTKGGLGGGEAPAAVPKPVAVIPGLAPVDVYGNLEPRGFTRKGPWKGEATGVFFCELESGEFTKNDAQLSVSMQGPSASEVRSITATALALTPEAAKSAARDFLSFVAKAPYEGADPDAAQSWVDGHVGSNAATTIGGVRFELFSNVPTALMLRIAPAETTR